MLNSESPNLLKCPDCGAAIDGGREGCQALWDELSTTGVFQHPAAFDAYCMQHLERYCKSAKSYAAHLTRLCCGIEHRGDPAIYRAIQQWLNGNVALTKPEILPFLGSLTIVDIKRAQNPIAQQQLVAAWIHNVWQAYASQHELAEEWIKLALR